MNGLDGQARDAVNGAPRLLAGHQLVRTCDQGRGDVEGIQRRETETACHLVRLFQKVLVGIDPNLDQIEVGPVEENLFLLSME